MKASLGFTQAGGTIQCENVFYLQDNTDAIFGSQSAVALNIYNAAVAHLVPQLFADCVINEVILEDVRTLVFGATVFPQTPAAGTKAGATGPWPTSACLSVKKNTGNPGRSGRGRWFWPIADASVTSAKDVISAAYAAAVVSALGAFQTAVEGAAPASTMGIVSYFQAKSLRPAGVFQRITSWSATDLFVDTQRRRLLGRGR